MKTKTEAKHTPGPWDFCADSQYSSKCLRGVQHSRKSAIHSSTEGRPTIASHVGNWADARLIAAAPDLLEALRKALAETYPGGADPKDPKWVTDARAAITRAELQ